MLGIACRTPALRPVLCAAAPPNLLPSTLSPSLAARSATPAPAGWATGQARGYFFDAAHQTALTLRELLRVSQPGGEALGVRPNGALLNDAMQSLVSSVCPRLDDDVESRSFFNELLCMHLSGLSAEELKALSALLRTAGFSGVATEAVWSDAVYEDFGFANGPPAQRQRTLMLPQDWQYLIEHVTEQAAAAEKSLTPGSLPNPAESRATRHLLAYATQRWSTADRSVNVLGQICHDLCGALGMIDAPTEFRVGALRSDASTIDWTGERLVLAARAFESLRRDPEGWVFNEVLRDLLEAVLARRMFGPQGHPSRLLPANQMLLHRAIDAIAAQPPFVPSAAMCDAAARLLAQSARFGKVQILPLTGVALGHAWIGNTLSVVPDKTQRATDIGKRLMRPGGRLQPEQCTVHEWPIRWLTPRENEDLYPAEHAWHITVPVPALQLQQSAAQVAKAWKAQQLPYRFIGTEPGMPSQGCRASVMQAIEHGMDDDARALFAHFNAGLAEPESPTEVALRMNRFMQWLRQLAATSASG